MLLLSIAAISLLAGILVCCGNGFFGSFAWLIWLPVSFLGFFLGLALIGFAFLMYLCKRVDQNVPQEEDSKFYRIVQI